MESLIKMEVKIDETYIQQGFTDHLAGFYTYLGSIPIYPKLAELHANDDVIEIFIAA